MINYMCLGSDTMLSPVEKVNGVREEIIIEVFVEVEHEVQTDLARVHNLFHSHADLLDITVLVEALNNCSAVESRHEEVDVAGSFPSFLSHHDFSFVVDVVDGSCEGLAGLMAEGVEDTNWTHVEVFDHLIVPSEAVLGILEPKLGLPHGLVNSIDDVVVIDNSVSVATIGFFVAVTNKHELSGPCLPKAGKAEGEVLYSVALSSGVVDTNGGHCFVFRVGSEIKIVELYLSLMLVPEPSDHGMVIGTLDGEFVGPLVLNGLEFSDGFTFFGLVSMFILIVGESESGVVEGPLLDDDEILGIVEGLDSHLCDVIEEVFVVDASDLLSLQVNDVDVRIGLVHNDYLTFVEHGEEVNDVRVAMLEEDFAICVNMDNALIGTRVDDL